MEKEQENKKELYTLAEWRRRCWNIWNRPAISGFKVKIDEKTRFGPRVCIEGDPSDSILSDKTVTIKDSQIGARTTLRETLWIQETRIGEGCNISNSIPPVRHYVNFIVTELSPLGIITDSVIGDNVTIEHFTSILSFKISNGCRIYRSSLVAPIGWTSFIGANTEIVGSRVAQETRVGANVTIENSRISLAVQLPDNIIVRGAYIRCGMIITEELVIESFVDELKFGKCFSQLHHPSIIDRYGLDRYWTQTNSRAETIVTPLCEHPVSHFISFKHKPDSAWKKDISFSVKELRNYDLENFDDYETTKWLTW